VTRYLSRLGLSAAPQATVAGLTELHRRHLASYDDWRTAMESLGVSLAGVADAELRSLHARMLAAHAEWAGAGAG
jgi:hypothetical protein